MTYALAYWNLLLGRLTAADTFAARIEGPAERRIAHLRIAMMSRDPSRVSHVMNREYPKPEEAAAVASGLIMAGRLEEARQALAILRERPNRGGTFANFIEGQIALADGNIDAGVEAIESHARVTGGHFDVQILANALSRRGDDARAVTVLESFSTARHRLVARPGRLAHDWLALRDQLSILCRKLGRDREAEAVDDELRALLAVADEDHPIKRRLENQVR